MATVDRVDRVIHRAVHHREVQHRHRRRLQGVTTIAFDAIRFQSVTASARATEATQARRPPVR